MNTSLAVLQHAFISLSRYLFSMRVRKNFKVPATIVLAVAVSLVALPFSSTPAAYAASSPALLKDVNLTEEGTSFFDGSGDERFFSFGGAEYFTASTEMYGQELWKTDGTEEGTVMVKDITEGENGSGPEIGNAVEMGGAFYLNIYTDEYEAELWKSDGTESGTRLVKDVDPSGSGYQSGLGVSGGNVFFIGRDGSHTEVWKTDGTEEGTVALTDFENLLPGGYNLNTLVVGDGMMYMGLWDYAANGARIYAISDDGLSVTEIKDADDFPLDTYSNDSMTAFGDTLIVTSGSSVITYDPLVGHYEVLRSSTTAEDLRVIDSTHLFFRGCDEDGCEPWVTDGTAIGTVQLADHLIGSDGSNPSIQDLKSGILVYTADMTGVDGNTIGIWQTDGTVEGTSLVYELTDEEYQSEGWPQYVTIGTEGEVYFKFCAVAQYGCELYSAANAERTLVSDINEGTAGSDISNLSLASSSDLLFVADDGQHGTELWKSDGSDGGTDMIYNFNAKTLGSSGEGGNPRGVAGDTLYFNADTLYYGYELWKTDGTPDGTTFVKDIRTGSNSSDPYDFVAVGETMYFTADTEDSGRELWKTDGTESGTVMVRDIRSGSQSSSPEDLVALGSTLYFTVDLGDGEELWKTDGTEEGTVQVTMGTEMIASGLVVFDGKIFFNGYDRDTELYELWKSDGTIEGTEKVSNIDFYNAYPDHLTVSGDLLYFVSDDETSGMELWKSDGTEEGTSMVKDIYPGSSSSDPNNLISFKGTLFFSAGSPDMGTELWKSDGTEEGTVQVKNIISSPSFSSGYPQDFMAVGDILFFEAQDNGVGYELWKTDGTEEGTVMVKEIYVGYQDAGILPIGSAGQVFYFAANDGEENHGNELWKSDGTEEGTVLVEDIFVGGDSYPSSGTMLGTTLIFWADDGQRGAEPFYIDGLDPTIVDSDEEEETPEEETPTTNNGNSGRGRSGSSVRPSSAPMSGSVSGARFSQNLQVGSSGNEVRELQKFLNTHGFVITLEGPGSPGNETDLFGAFTRTALSKFQAANGISPASGYFGPLTRAFIETMTGATSPQPSAPSITVRNLQTGMTGSDISALQTVLIALGHVIPAGVTGFFGEQTQSALAAYQAANGISPASGYFGPVTRAQMKSKGLSGLWW